MASQTPSPFATLVITGNPAFDTLIRYALVAALAASTTLIGKWLSSHGITDPNILVAIAGALASAIGAGVVIIWGIIRGTVERAIGVQAGINLTVAGAALDAAGNVVAKNDGTTPPLPVTVATAKQIIADFAPTTVPSKS